MTQVYKIISGGKGSKIFIKTKQAKNRNKKQKALFQLLNQDKALLINKVTFFNSQKASRSTIDDVGKEGTILIEVYK